MAEIVLLTFLLMGFMSLLAVLIVLWPHRQDKPESKCRSTSYMCECDEEGKKRSCKCTDENCGCK